MTAPKPPRPLAFALSPLLLLLGPPAHADVPAAAPYEAVAEALAKIIDHERVDKGIPAATIALVDGRKVVWSADFGLADPALGRAADSGTVMRVGSVSKLFTDLALMQLVEAGKVDLDAPVAEYLPDFRPENPHGKPITLRQVLAHRSGLLREPPAGHYFDPSEPSLAETVESLNRTTLILPPEEGTKYSNAGISLVGRVVEAVRGEPFAETIGETLLAPLGMDRSAFVLRDDLKPHYAASLMWTYDGREFPAPTFELTGLGPAGNLYSTADDLARFLAMLFARGEGERGRVISRAGLESMWEPQFGGRFGLGFALGRLEGKRRIGHNGAVYGFATELAALPDEELGVAVILSKDCSNVVAGRIANLALRMMLAAKAGEPLPEPETTEAVPPAEMARAVGLFKGEREVFEVARSGDDLYLQPRGGGFRRRLRKLGDSLIVDDAYRYGPTLSIEADGARLGDERLTRIEDDGPPPAPPERWRGLIGEYGWDHNVLYVFEREGRLHALIEWFELDPLEEAGDDVFRFPDAEGMYPRETLRFERDADGRAVRAIVADAVVFERRPIQGEDGRTFRVEPAEPVDALREKALAAEPPAEGGDFREPELVELAALDPSIRLDIRYAGADNFLGAPFYSQGRAFLQRPAAEALVRAHRALKDEGYGLLIHDGYRPWYVTKMFHDATRGPDRRFVADPAEGSRHNRGCAVDLTLYSLETGEPVEMVGGYDEFSPRSNPDYIGGTARQRWHRDLLRRTLEAEGFRVNEVEWWHFDFKDWAEYPILNVPFERLAPAEEDDPAADATEPPPADEFVVIPLRVHVLTSDDLPDADCKLTDEDIGRILSKVNRIWHVAGVHFGLESIRREPAARVARFRLAAGLDEAAEAGPRPGRRPTPLNLYRLLIPEDEGRRFDGLHVYYLHRFPVNGVYMGGDFAIVQETARLRPVPGGIDEPIPRVTAHELGHALGLSHRQDRTNLLASGTTGTLLNRAEVAAARAKAGRTRGALTLDALHARIASSDDPETVRRLRGWLDEIPGASAR